MPEATRSAPTPPSFATGETELLAELSSLDEIYESLESVLSAPASDAATSRDESALAILERREVFERVTRLDRRIELLGDEWRRRQAAVLPEVRERIRLAAGALRERSVRIAALAAARAGELEDMRHRIEEELGEIRKGNRLLASLKGPRQQNQTRFFDSRG